MPANPDIVYFCHGIPGGPDDVKLLHCADLATSVITPNLYATDGCGDFTSNLLKQFDGLTSHTKGRPIQLVGFSIGAMAAIKIAGQRPNHVGQLTLISPAAPLSLGNFLPDMAGKPVFELAAKHHKLLSMLTFGQGLITRIAPNFLIKQLFANSGEAEKKLLEDPVFLDIIEHGFKNSFIQHPKQYAAFLQEFIQDWSADLDLVNCPVEIWHGANDTWSPLSMSHALCHTITGSPRLHIVRDGEHYSTLTKAQITPLI